MIPKLGSALYLRPHGSAKQISACRKILLCALSAGCSLVRVLVILIGWIVKHEMRGEDGIVEAWKIGSLKK